VHALDEGVEEEGGLFVVFPPVVPEYAWCGGVWWVWWEVFGGVCAGVEGA